MKALARSPSKRYQTAAELGDAIQEYLDLPTSGAVPTQAKEIQRWIADGRAALAHKESLLEDAAILSDTIEMEKSALDLQDPAQKQSAAWAAQRSIATVHEEIATSTAKAIHLFTQALGAEPDNISARTALVDLLTNELETARLCGNLQQISFYKALLSEHDRGHLADMLEGRGSLHLDVQPSTAEIHLSRMRIDGAVLRPEAYDRLENPPIELNDLEEGIYALTLDAPGHATVKTTFAISPARCTRLRIRLVGHGLVPEGFVHIPAGTFLMGPKNQPSKVPTEQALPDCIIQRYPVTAAEYLTFLRQVSLNDPDAAAKRLPRLSSPRRQLWPTQILERGHVTDIEGWHDDLPIVGVSASDAIAYARWLGERIGRRFRLPSEEEWEKAARGSEGRVFPWGDDWNPALCACPESWPHEFPPKVTDFSDDRSTSQVHGLAGGVREWTGSRAIGRIERLIVKGGSFRSNSSDGRALWSRDVLVPKCSTMDLGFRLVAELNP